ncbi:protein FAR1-RELATED SEQUENCE 6-like [Chenopodium quinoa]|uniref:protein FAR1-RELATED SEQUENCE 6-like n=1 Tax=Chenopodium quinoa TaxID=63459 RepID=UPI000B76B982|nr:protein FAR1-RELATED SEQUENCE 6-like [Chenopodium quinoa]
MRRGIRLFARFIWNIKGTVTLRKARDVAMFRKHELVVKNKHLVKQACNAKKSRVKISQTYSCIARERNGVDQLAFTQKDLENAVSELKKLELTEGDANGMIEYFQKMSSDNQNFFHLCRFGKDGALFHFPFAVFLGVNHHGQSILLGYALISRETVETWCIWHILQKFGKYLGKLEKYEELSDELENIIYGSLVPEEFDDRWMDAIEHYKLQKNSWLEGVVFEECELILYGCCCGDHRLKSLYLERHMWVLAYLKHLFWAGMRTTQRSKSFNHFFKGYVDKNTTLSEFVLRYCDAMQIRAEAERIADSNTLRYVRELATAFPVEEVFQKCYTDSKFKEVQQECKKILYVRCIDQIEISDKLVEYILEDRVWIKPKNARKESVTKIRRCYRVMYDSSTFEAPCDCKHFECHGIICRHMIFVYDLSGVGIVPEKYILRRWRIDMQRKHTRVKVAYHDPLKTDESGRGNCYGRKKRKQEMEENGNEQQQLEDEAGREKDLVLTPSSVGQNKVTHNSARNTALVTPSSAFQGSCEGSFVDLSGAILDLSGAIPDQSSVTPDPPLPKKKNHRTTNKRYPSCTEKKGKEKAARAKNAAKKLAAKNSTTSVTLSSHEYIRSAGMHMTDLDGSIANFTCTGYGS